MYSKKQFFKNKYFNYIPLASKIVERRTNSIADNVEDFIKFGDKVLDVGAGGGWLAQEIKERKKAEVILLDVFDFNQTGLKNVIYDGKKIPFADNSFDAAIVIYILHHADNQKQILEEIKRVVKDKIIIMEDVYSSYSGKIARCIWCFLTNLPSFFVRPFAEKFSFSFRKVSEWEEFFHGANLKLIFKKEIKSFAKMKNMMFVLEKQK